LGYLPSNSSLIGSPALLAGTVDITTGVNAKYVNKDTVGDGAVGYNPTTIRFRHLYNTTANVLCVDGHVQSFHYNAVTRKTDMPRTFIYVNQ
jgi:hypothetical protein